MKSKFKLLSICLLAACLVGSVTACFGESEMSESLQESFESSSSISGSDSESSSDNESSSDSESSEVAEKYTVAFVDYDDSVISTAEYEVGAAVVQKTLKTIANRS